MESPLSATSTPRRALIRRQVRVRGVVQGVGFRPFVYALAARLALTGEVSNDIDGVLAQVQGAPADVEAFCRAVESEAPPLSVVESVSWQDVPTRPESGFTIAASDPTASGSPGRRTLVPADVATCADCLAELTDPADRRYRHPFITCTNCGPRFTIITGLPYDRPMTTMAGFALCTDCAREYADPADRRFHAQPVACHACGPELEFVEPGHDPCHREAALARARQVLAAGGIVAVKGIGGYHLACDATDPQAVARLRRRKQRGDKPFAVLVPDLETARRIVEVDDVAAGLLSSPRRPIVLLPVAQWAAQLPYAPVVADEVAPRVGRLGVMLPPSALHRLLFGLHDDPPGPQVLVLTSGNLAGEPIVTDDAAALERLAGIADAWLRHDRAIHVPCDDSVVTVADGAELPIRRSRGHAPMPVGLPFEVAETLAVGGDLKNTFCLAQGRSAWMSGHLGDMDDLATQTAFECALAQLQALVEVTPCAVVSDAHPGYRSAAWARRRAAADGLEPPVVVQHHHAHLAAVMAENQVEPDATVLGFAFDGTGFGPDGAIWGGEALLARYDSFVRLAQLDYVPLPGGDATVQRTYRMALSQLWHAGIDWDAANQPPLPPVVACPDDERRVVAHQLATGLGCVPTSSMGRLFDAVASLLGVCHRAGYEAQAAMELQALAEQAVRAGKEPGEYTLPLLGPPAADVVGAAPAAAPPWRWDVAALVGGLVDDVRAGREPASMALGFHRAVAVAVADLADRAADLVDDRRVALSGGVFCNGLLLTLTRRALSERGFTVLTHRLVPPNDGGLALGQIAVGARRRGASRAVWVS
ncbi:MAG: carbamoyltransferase HypF [Kineosporiaceae bacterium]